MLKVSNLAGSSYNYVLLDGANNLGLQIQPSGTTKAYLMWNDPNEEWRVYAGGGSSEDIKMVVKKTGNVGGYYDPTLEAIVRLKPDLVIMLEEQARAMPNFRKLKLETLVVSHQSIDGIIESFRTIGRVCGKGPEGRRMAGDVRRALRRDAGDRVRPHRVRDRGRLCSLAGGDSGEGRSEG